MTNLTAYLTITQVERETGLSKDVLRAWERRYGVPKPRRSERGERLYSSEEVSRLRDIRRLINLGHRPGQVLKLSRSELAALLQYEVGGQETQSGLDDTQRAVLEGVRRSDLLQIRRLLGNALARQGLQRFVVDTLSQLNREIGEAWARGELGAHHEHLYSEEAKRILSSAIYAAPRASGHPRMLLTTTPGEEHGLGILMVEAYLTAEDVTCLGLGTQTPLQDIIQACAEHRADILALSFSQAYPSSQAFDALDYLRGQLPERVTIWAGGAGVARLRRIPPGVSKLGKIEESRRALHAWRATHAATL